MPDQKLKIGITLGDINGIGPEVIVKALEDKRILNLCTPVIYGSNRIFSFYKKLLNAEHFNYTTCNGPDSAHPKNINIINCINEEVTIQPGIETLDGAKCAKISLDAATADLLEGKIDALVTAPINKSNMHQVGFEYPGHTEYFNAKAGVKESVMLLMNDQIKVGLVTNHLPIKEVASAIQKEIIIQKLEILNLSLKQDFARFKPTIAVLGLNPHSGDKGLLGDEEKNIIYPAIQFVQDKKIMAMGPYSADGFFGSGNYLKFDGILAMYHDQGLIPFKALSFGSGVNFTAGLPFIRTSPDHGTAYEIAGKNIAAPESMMQAIFTAIDISSNRKSYKESIANPIRKTIVESERGKVM